MTTTTQQRRDQLAGWYDLATKVIGKTRLDVTRVEQLARELAVAIKAVDEDLARQQKVDEHLARQLGDTDR